MDPSLSLDRNSELKPLEEQVPVMAEEAYITRVYKILTAIDRKKAQRKLDKIETKNG